MSENAINQVNEETILGIGKIMGSMAQKLFIEHADSIIERLQEEALDNEGSTQITIPMKMLIVHDNGEFEIKPSIDLKKMTKITFELDPVKWNPNQPDLFDGKKQAGAEAEEAAAMPASGTPADDTAEKPPKKQKSKADKKKPADDKDTQCDKKDPKFGLCCRLEKGHDGPCRPKPCAFQHEDGKRICMAEEGHEGMHSFVDKSELNK